VIQKHAARSLHYDFRLELDGVLLSWSVPKGPSLTPGAKRLAVRTEDHPLAYADFEGIIPAGEYGGGTVIVWDQGSWQPEGDAREGIKKGRLTFQLKGDKLSGRFHLVRTRLNAQKRENWLLFKGHDEGEARAADGEIIEQRPESALSGRTLEEVKATPTKVWHSNRSGPAQDEPLDGEGARVSKSSARASGRSTRAKSPAKTRARSRGAKESNGSGSADVLQLVQGLNLGIKFSNLEKVLYPEQNLRKAELIAYYASIASVMLPHVQDRPLTLVRCPNGRGKCFFQKHANEGVPDFVRRVPIAEADEKFEDYLVVDDPRGLVSLAQLGVLEVHTWPCHAAQVERPDQFVFDLDPGEGLAWSAVTAATLELRDRLQALGLESFVKTTGGKGLHVVLPVRPQLDWDTHKAFASALSDAMARDSPRKYLTSMRKDQRKGRVFLDYLRNGRGATAVAPYSTRAREGATVATPLSWDELEAKTQPSFNVGSVLGRLSQPDPWREYSKLKQTISAKALSGLGLKGS